MLGRLTTRRAALLAVVVCALALSVAVPLHTYLSQRDDLAQQLQQQQALRDQENQLAQRAAQLSDPAQVEAEARTRLHFVMPGETPYEVQLPGAPVAGGSQLANLMTGAVHKAALAARDELIGLAISDPDSPFRELKANTLLIADGVISSPRHAGPGIPIAELMPSSSKCGTGLVVRKCTKKINGNVVV